VGELDLTRIDRRAFMAGVVATALAGTAAAACSGDDDDAEPASADRPGTGTADAELPSLPGNLPAELFALGVASGDPLPDSVILWTRIVADPLADDGGVCTQPIPVQWEIAADDGFAEVVASGDAVADKMLAHSVHVDVSMLDPDTWYWYRFKVGDAASPVGRTRTTPSASAEPDELRFAFASCQNRQSGYWTAYPHMAEEELDLVLFLGDYIYEEGPNPGSVQPYGSPAPTEIVSFRKRWGEYKADPALQAVHARCPWVVTWDDHEVSNDYADDFAEGTPADASEADRAEFLERRAAAYQAFYEHQPVRLDPPEPESPDFPIYRDVTWGKLAAFFVLDGRQYRSRQACTDTATLGGAAGPMCPEGESDDRTMLGEEQESWLYDKLADTDATWNVLANQTVLSPAPFAGNLVNLDQWDGYPAARQRLVDNLQDVSNPVVITGDIHLSAVGILPGDPADPTSTPLATEFVGTSISSNFPLADVVEPLLSALPNVRYINARQRGYVVCTVTADELRADYRLVSTALEPTAEVTTATSWIVKSGNPAPQPA
jgi:alkaline phosphatase D